MLKKMCHSCHAAPRGPSVCLSVGHLFITRTSSLSLSAARPFICHTLLILSNYFLLLLPVGSSLHHCSITPSMFFVPVNTNTLHFSRSPKNSRLIISPFHFFSALLPLGTSIHHATHARCHCLHYHTLPSLFSESPSPNRASFISLSSLIIATCSYSQPLLYTFPLSLSPLSHVILPFSLLFLLYFLPFSKRLRISPAIHLVYVP